MKIKYNAVASAVLGVILSAGAPLSAQANAGGFFPDPQLDALIENNRLNAKAGRVIVRTRIENTSSETVDGPLRIVIDSNRKVLNADGYTEEGLPFVYVCNRCEIAAGELSKRVRIALKRPSFRQLFRNPKLRKLRLNLVAEHVPFSMQVLHNADMDGASGALENVVGFSAVLEALRSSYPDRTLTLSSGDNYIPGPRFDAASDASAAEALGIVAGEGRGDILFLNAMAYQASAVGNHELDRGPGVFASLIAREDDAVNTFPGTSFPYLSANLDFSADANTAPLLAPAGQPAELVANALTSSTTIEVDGQIIGIVGASAPTLGQITSTGDIGVAPSDPADLAALAAIIQNEVDRLTATGINKVILLAHMQQIAVESQLATLLNDVDVIIAGGSNTLLADETDILRDGDVAADVYPLTFESAKGEPVLVINTDGDYEYVGRLVSSFDLAGRIIAESLDPAINGAYATDDAGLAALGNPTPNAEVVAIADALSAVLAASEGNLFGSTDVYLDGRRNEVRTEETNLGNLTADANMQVASDMLGETIDVSLKNGGGIRDAIGFFIQPPGTSDPADIQFLPPAAIPSAGKVEGDISQADIQGALLFNNGLTVVTVTAAELREILEHGVSATEPGATPGQFPQVGGLRFSFDPSATPRDPNVVGSGSRVRSVAIYNGDTLVDTVVQNGAVVGDPNRSFRMVVLDFLANGGDGYPIPQADRVDLSATAAQTGVANFANDGTEQDALAEFLAENFATTAFAEAETTPEQDERIQNLSVRADTVLAP